jgi:hypothetical protein
MTRRAQPARSFPRISRPALLLPATPLFGITYLPQSLRSHVSTGRRSGRGARLGVVRRCDNPVAIIAAMSRPDCAGTARTPNGLISPSKSRILVSTRARPQARPRNTACISQGRAEDVSRVEAESRRFSLGNQTVRCSSLDFGGFERALARARARARLISGPSVGPRPRSKTMRDRPLQAIRARARARSNRETAKVESSVRDEVERYTNTGALKRLCCVLVLGACTSQLSPEPPVRDAIGDLEIALRGMAPMAAPARALLDHRDFRLLQVWHARARRLRPRLQARSQACHAERGTSSRSGPAIRVLVLRQHGGGLPLASTRKRSGKCSFCT